MKIIDTSPRTEGMVDASASYYQESEIFKAIQNTQALEYDRINDATEELDLQLSPITATWGLSFWEIAVGIPPNSTGDYEARRPLILSRMLNEKNFGAATIQEMAANYGEKIDVVIDSGKAAVVVTFYNGIPPFLNEFKKTLESLIHAHMGIEFNFTYKSVGKVYVASRHTLAPTILVHPYTLGAYSTRSNVRTTVRIKTACIITISGRKE